MPSLKLTTKQREKLERDLERLEEQRDDRVDSLVEQVSLAYRQTVDDAIKDIRAALESAQVDEKGNFVPNAQLVSRVRLGTLRHAQSVREVWSRWSKELGKLEKTINDAFKLDGRNITIGDVDKEMLKVLRGQWPTEKQRHGTGLAGQFYDMTHHHRMELANAVTRNVLGRSSRRSLVRDLQNITGRSRGQATQLVQDATMEYARTVTAEKSHDYDYFIYVGPTDSITREFCAGLVNQIWSREEISGLDNGQNGTGADVLVTGGGYRCRHHWRPVERDWYSNEEWKSLRGDRWSEDENIDDTDELVH